MSQMAPWNPRRLLSEAGRAAKKSWGQHFLCDQNILSAIALAAAGDRPKTVVELGAGLGALTYHLLRLAGHVVAVERDRDLVPLLRKTLSWATNLEIVEANALTYDYAAHAARIGSSVHVAGNLPYQLASRIMVNLAGSPESIARAVFLVQREVAERICADPGQRDYGLLSVLIQRAFLPRLLRFVTPAAFFPRPKVESAVLSLERNSLVVDAHEGFFVVAAARAGFSARRKILRNALSAGLKISPAAAMSALATCGIDPKARAEMLGVADFLRLGRALNEIGALPARGNLP